MDALGVRGAQGSLEAAAGQTLLLAFEGRVAPPAILDAIRAGEAAGVALYRLLNVDNPGQIRALTDALRAAAAAGGHPAPLIAADQEGGQLIALGDETTPFPGNMALGAAGSDTLARRVGRAVGFELAAMGINVNWAPVCDINTDPRNPVVGTRAFGEEPERVARLAGAMIEGFQSAGIAATAKHFPGNGETAVDPHHGLPIVEHDVERLRRVELVPFSAAVRAGVKLVMTAHVALPAIDEVPDRPAMLSPRILNGLLRDELGFDGVLVTDALDMGALDQSGVVLDAIAAVGAGVDLLLAGPAQAHREKELAQIRRGLVQAARRGLISPDALTRAGGRVLDLRRWLGDAAPPPLEVVGCAEHRELAAEVARGSVTLVRDRAALLPLRPGSADRILLIVPRPADLTPADTSSYVTITLADELRRHHGSVDEVAVPIDLREGESAAVRDRAQAYDLVIVGTINAPDHAGQAALVEGLVAAGVPTIAVALRTPYDLGAYPSAPTYLCTYSIQPPSMAALAEGIFGRIPFLGTLPVSTPALADGI